MWKRLKRIIRKILRHGEGERRIAWPTREEIIQLPSFEALGPENIVEVSTPEGARRVARELSKETVVGFDTESKPTFKKGQVSQGPHVVQFATLKRAYVVLLHEKETRRVVASLIGMKSLKKIGFGLIDDVRRIRTKLHVKPRSVFDLETLFSKKGYGRGVGVKVGVAIALGKQFHKSKRVSTSNWASRHLSDKQLMYAANDAYAPIRVWHHFILVPVLKVPPFTIWK